MYKLQVGALYFMDGEEAGPLFVYIGVVCNRSKHKFINTKDPEDVRKIPINLNRLLNNIARTFSGYLGGQELKKYYD